VDVGDISDVSEVHAAFTFKSNCIDYSVYYSVVSFHCFLISIPLSLKYNTSRFLSGELNNGHYEGL
jgi:hypothetical protein